MEKLKTIDFFKVLLTINILWFHTIIFFWQSFSTDKVLSKLNNGIANGDKALDFFFIIAGFLLFYNFDKNKTVIDFIKGKIVRLWPLIAFSILVLLIAHKLIALPFRKYDAIFTLLFMDNMGFTPHSGGNAPVWWVSVLFFVSLFYFYLKKYFNEKTVTLSIALIIWFSYSFLIHINNGDIHGFSNTFGYVFNMGLMRGLGGIGLGYFIAMFYKSYHVSQPNSFKTLRNTIFEGFLLFFLVSRCMFDRSQIDNALVYIIFFVILFWLFLMKQGLISKLADNKVFSFLSQYTYSIFIMQWPVLSIMQVRLFKNHAQFISDYPLSCVLCAFWGCTIIGIIVYYAVEVPSANYLKKIYIKKNVHA